MEKISVVFVDVDENYLMALEKKFVEELGGYINISIITDMYYFGKYFSKPKDIDILVINEQVYSADINKHNIKYIYILKETPIIAEQDSINNCIYKYTSVVDVFLQIASNEILKNCIVKKNSTTEGVITVCSPIGGSGKTTIALGLALSLTKLGKKVIYVSMDSLQSFGYFLDVSQYMPADFSNFMLSDANTLKDSILNYIKTDIFDFLMPFKGSLARNKVEKKQFLNVIKAIELSNKYEYIIVDTDSTIDDELNSLIDMSNKVMIVTMQDKLQAAKTELFVASLDKVDEEKCIYICNKYIENRENDLINHINSFYIKEYLYYDSSIIDSKIKALIGNMEIEKLENIL